MNADLILIATVVQWNNLTAGQGSKLVRLWLMQDDLGSKIEHSPLGLKTKTLTNEPNSSDSAQKIDVHKIFWWEIKVYQRRE